MIHNFCFYTDSQTETRDKSAWRKSNLNVSNTTEDADERKYRRQRPLHSIDEHKADEDKRKNIIQSLGDRAATDKLSIYIRRPTDPSPDVNKLSSTTTSPEHSNKQSIYIKQSGTTPPAEKHSIYIRQNKESPSIISSIHSSPDSEQDPSNRRKDDGQSVQRNRAEIDADNIETPPTTRRILNPSCKRFENPRPLHPETLELTSQKNLINPVEQETLGDGQFDRFSATRRTRRFKRPTDYSSGTEERTSSTTPESPPKNSDAKETVSKRESDKKKPDRLEEWQHKIKSLDADLGKEEKKSTSKADAIANRMGKLGGRSISKISQEDVRDAIRSLKSPTPDRAWDAPKDFIHNGPVTTTKIVTHELNDEGFEETQSLVSDTPSHGKDSTSSCNDVTDTKTLRRKPERLASTDSAATSASDVSRSKRFTPSSSSKSSTNTLQSLIVKNQQSLEKSRSLRGAPPSKISQIQAKRATSMRGKGESSSLNRRLDVERSSSRASLRSSRSSINSAISTNTVRKVPLKSTTQPSPDKKPLAMQNSSTASKSNARTPASRSSSSGSSIGPNRKTPVKSSTNLSSNVSTSFKENQRESSLNTRSIRGLSSKSTSSNSTGTGSNKTAVDSNSSRSNTTRTSGISRPTTSSFMRPTAASATKVKGK